MSQKSKIPVNKILIIIVVLVLIAAFRIFNIGDYLSLSYIKESQQKFADLYLHHRFAVISGYMGIYILVTSLSLPGAAVMTLAGGALFGLVTGTVIVSFASTIGATLACFVARFILRDCIRGKFGEKLNDLGVTIINTKADNSCHIDRHLISGAGPKAANDFGRLAAKTLLDDVHSK